MANQAYETLMVAALFGEWAPRVAHGAAFDALVSQFGLMFFSDRKAAIREAMRVLVPGGRLLPEDPIARILAQAENVLRSYLTSDGSAAFDTSVLIVAARKG